jgi:hypothetical protein
VLGSPWAVHASTEEEEAEEDEDDGEDGKDDYGRECVMGLLKPHGGDGRQSGSNIDVHATSISLGELAGEGHECDTSWRQ